MSRPIAFAIVIVGVAAVAVRAVDPVIGATGLNTAGGYLGGLGINSALNPAFSGINGLNLNHGYGLNTLAGLGPYNSGLGLYGGALNGYNSLLGNAAGIYGNAAGLYGTSTGLGFGNTGLGVGNTGLSLGNTGLGFGSAGLGLGNGILANSRALYKK